MLYQLPTPIPANYSYDAVRIENMRYDGTQYTADVFGVSGGQPLPLIIGTPSGLQRITQCAITDAEIDEVLATHPEITVRMEAGLFRAMQRLFALVQS
jgi:hypothetical protein